MPRLVLLEPVTVMRHVARLYALWWTLLVNQYWKYEGFCRI
ncbi:hypothetical protein Hsw_1022 [Hymenobacter swuensis DY53]|uniref:Uncharacterized protein n=1 Tax=Hymenobacter swuensis DY53 TaxID=1227739 RepID=W8EXW9_9BACT|nr:hypothetical protein Hsw_1022 [Hymenobacter swuensis DY53]